MKSGPPARDLTLVLPPNSPGFRPVPTPRRQKAPLQVEHLNAVVGLVRDVQATIRPDDHSAGIAEFARTSARFSPFVQLFACSAVDGNPVGMDLFRDHRAGKMTEIDVAQLVERDSARIGQNGEVT